MGLFLLLLRLTIIIYPMYWNFRIFAGLIFPLNSPASPELALLVQRLAEPFSAKVISGEFSGSSGI